MADALRACRSCHAAGLRPFLSLGQTPLADALVDEAHLSQPEATFPLDVAFCPSCSLVQILHDVPPQQLYVDNYLYFSSFSDYLLQHAKELALGLIESRRLGPDSLVAEIASNDGYLLRYFAERGIPVLGIDPAPQQAEVAAAAGITTLEEFFTKDLALRLRAEGKRPDVIIANNVMAHVPDLDGFVEGMRTVVAEDGHISIENPNVRDLIERCAFDTIYHEHHSYLSCTAVDSLMRRHDLYLNHVETFPDLHGGTIRWHVGPREDVSDEVRWHLKSEAEEGMTDFSYYRHFGARVEAIKSDLLALLRRLKDEGAVVAAYGAAAKGSTLLNYVGIGADLVSFVVDRNVYKQGKYMPGVHLPILETSALLERKPDYLLLLAWNFKDEIMSQQREYLEQGGRCIVPVPEPRII
jgi:SAM-dependent methyltransferase